jgi:hypothetical protein
MRSGLRLGGLAATELSEPLDPSWAVVSINQVRRRNPRPGLPAHIGESLVKAMELALASVPPEAAQLVAWESVVLAETKDHLNWKLLHEALSPAQGKEKKALSAAYEAVEEEEVEHLYHTTGWCRELWIESLGLPAVLPPPEEEKEVKTAVGAARQEGPQGDALDRGLSR